MQPALSRLLADAVSLSPSKILNPESAQLYGGIRADAPVLVILAAGKGTRFGQSPKCIQPVQGSPLARHSIEAFRRFSLGPAVCMVGYKHEEVSEALGADNVYVRSDNPAGGTAFAAYEAFCVRELAEINPVVVLTMGDRIVPPSVYRELVETHRGGAREAALTLLTAEYEPPRNQGRGRVLRDGRGRVTRIIEDRDIQQWPDERERERMAALTEGNCPLYAVRAATLARCLRAVTNENAQSQFYLTDVIEMIAEEGGEIRTITTRTTQPEYDLLCADVTRPDDLALLEGIVESARGLLWGEELEVEAAAEAIRRGRPAGQVASITRQLREIAAASAREQLGFDPESPAAIGISGGRLRIAFMHPDMGRFFGPAWQMPIGAADADGGEQIVLVAQESGDRRIHLFPLDPKHRESINSVEGDEDHMYPGEEVNGPHAYEGFGTRMSERVLLHLGYFSDAEIEARRTSGLPLPPASLWVNNGMRRPFSLVMNALASMRTVRGGRLGGRVQASLGRESFSGLRVASTGDIPQGGFSSSSALTVAVKNAVNALHSIGIPPDLLVHLACQAEYGTGVRAGSLDQATEQKGRYAQGTLMSSNPRDNYAILATHPVPADRIRILFPYTVHRDRDAWRWSGGVYGESPASDKPTTGEMRKMTGKSAEIAAILTELPLDRDFFKVIEADLTSSGALSVDSRRWVAGILARLPLLISRAELKERVPARLEWFAGELALHDGISLTAAREKARSTIDALFSGWRDPALRRASGGGVVVETGVPLRAMTAYLFGEVCKNFRLIAEPEAWGDWVSRSQRGDRCFDIDPARLPGREDLETLFDWEKGLGGPARLDGWLEQAGATPFDFNRGLDDATLLAPEPPDFAHIEGSNFFRGLALIDFAEALLIRAFGPRAAAVRVNAAGQGDYFQVHVDARLVAPGEVKSFLRKAFYERFDLTPAPEFVEVHPGGGAAGVRLSRHALLERLIRRLERGD